MTGDVMVERPVKQAWSMLVMYTDGGVTAHAVARAASRLIKDEVADADAVEVCERFGLALSKDAP